MTSATDIITYIGVPLTVIGVAPILWNVFKGVGILRSLKKSIPRRARGYIFLSLDPAGGVVSVTADRVFFTCDAVIQQLRESTEKIFRNATPTGQVRPLDSTLSPKSLDPVTPQWLASSWMGLLSADVVICIDRHQAAQRFVVDAAMSTEVVSVSCDWQSFVLLALAVGTDANDPDFMALAEGRRGIFELKADDRGTGFNRRDTMTVTSQSDSLVASLSLERLVVSWRAAYAWTLTMMLVSDDGKTLLVVPLLDRTQVPTAIKYPSLDTDQMNLEESTTQLAHGLTWALYTEGVFHERGYDQKIPELLPVPQPLLKIREDVLHSLQACENLDDKIKAIFPSDILRKKVLKALQQGWIHLLRVENNEPTTRGYDSDPLGYADIWEELSDVPLFKELYLTYGPLTFWKYNEPPEELETSTLKGILARIIIATSVIQKWRRNEWRREMILDGGENDGKEVFKVPENPVVKLLKAVNIPKTVRLT